MTPETLSQSEIAASAVIWHLHQSYQPDFEHSSEDIAKESVANLTTIDRTFAEKIIDAYEAAHGTEMGAELARTPHGSLSPYSVWSTNGSQSSSRHQQ